MIINVDFHIHSYLSGATSKDMNIDNISFYGSLKGLDVIGSGDILNIKWLKNFENMERIDDGTFFYRKTRFILTSEIEDMNRVHHILFFPSISKVYEVREKFSKSSQNMDTDGRPKIRLDGAEIAEICRESDVLIGPAHAFTPWTSLYAYHDSIVDAYKDYTKYIKFLELGLSADTDYADRISELKDIVFLSNSDAHSYHPNKLAREFNRINVNDATFDEIKRAIENKRIYMNIGVPPEEGKYNETACTRCYTHYSLDEAKKFSWRCPKCKGIIKKGVKDRVNELANYDKPVHPEHRPPYLRIIPLIEIIGKSMNINPLSERAENIWNKIVTKFGNEINVLVDLPIREMKNDIDVKILNGIVAFRMGKIRFDPGGGGKYGEIHIPEIIKNDLKNIIDLDYF